MVKKENVLRILDGVLHPEGGVGLVSGGFVGDVEVVGDRILVELRFRRARDPFGGSLRRQAEGVLVEAFPGMGVEVRVGGDVVDDGYCRNSIGVWDVVCGIYFARVGFAVGFGSCDGFTVGISVGRV